MRASFFLLVFSAGVAVARPPVSLADLRLLAGDQASLELLEKAEDVPPAERSPEWKQLVTTAAAAVTAKRRMPASAFAEAQAADALAVRFTFLSADAGFVSARADAVVRGLEACAAEGDGAGCWEVERQLEKTVTGAGAFKLAKALVKLGVFKARPVLLFSADVTAQDTTACKDGDLVDAVLAAVDLSADSEQAKAAVRLLSQPCWESFAPKARELLRGAQDDRLRNLCKPLRAKKALSDLQSDLCQDVGL